VISVTFGYSSAGRTPTTSASALAWTMQGKPSHVAQRMQVLKGMLPSSSMIPQGAWNGWKPAFARSSERRWMRGSCDTGGNG
jgi:hypothetical protein